MTTTSNKIRKKCMTCERTQVVPIRQSTCYLSKGINKPTCTGILQPYSGDFDDAVLNLIAAAKDVTDKSRILKWCIEDLETWVSESDHSPASMGWVGKDGRP